MDMNRLSVHYIRVAQLRQRRHLINTLAGCVVVIGFTTLVAVHVAWLFLPPRVWDASQQGSIVQSFVSMWRGTISRLTDQ